MTHPEPPTTAELRAAFKRATWLRFGGWTYERAIATPLIAWSLRHAALSRRHTEHLPAQPRLI